MIGHNSLVDGVEQLRWNDLAQCNLAGLLNSESMTDRFAQRVRLWILNEIRAIGGLLSRTPTEPKTAASARTHSGTVCRHMTQKRSGSQWEFSPQKRSGADARTFAQIHAGSNGGLFTQLHSEGKTLTFIHVRIGLWKRWMAHTVYWVIFFRAEVERRIVRQLPTRDFRERALVDCVAPVRREAPFVRSALDLLLKGWEPAAFAGLQ